MKHNRIPALSGLLMLILMMSSCYKAPSPVDKDGEYLVYTYADEEKDFSKYTTFHIADSILVVDNNSLPVYDKSKFAVSIVDSYRKNMEGLGYVFTEDKDNADLGIQVTYIVETQNYIQYFNDPYWWMDYPGYWWTPGYWGSWDRWSYPYPVSYSVSTNTFLAEMVDLTSAEGDGKELQVIWNSFINGPQGSSLYNNLNRVQKAVEQSFSQSGYLKK